MHQLLGYSEEELYGQNARMLYETQEEFERVERVKHAQILEKGIGSVETKWVGKDGSIHEVYQSSGAIIFQELSAGLVFTALDITEQKAMERERASLEAQFHQSKKMEAIGRLTGGIAHDFNNLLTGIIGFSELSLLSLNSQDPLYSNIKEIKNAADRAAQLTQQLLSFGRKQTEKLQSVNLNEKILQSQKMLGRILGENINLVFVPSEKLWSIQAGTHQIDQVLINLVVNAREAMPQGGKLDIRTQNISFENASPEKPLHIPPGEYVLLEVTDTGSGMDSESMEHIFEPFYTTKSDTTGTGLGLATVHGIISQIRGYVDVISEIGRGDRKSTRLNSSHTDISRMPSSA